MWAPCLAGNWGRQFTHPLALLLWAAAGFSWLAGDVLLLVEERDKISADGRILCGTIELDASTLTGESLLVARSAKWADTGVPLLQARDLVFSGTTCTGGEAQVVAVATDRDGLGIDMDSH